MAVQRRVDVVELRSASSQVGAEKVVLTGVHTETAAGLITAQSGWVGSSAAALSQITTRWGLVSAVHAAAIGTHGGNMQCAAWQFADTEARNAAAVADVGAAG